MSQISTHVLDNASGRPGTGITVSLEFQSATGWQVHGGGVTDGRGRISNLLSQERVLAMGTYRLTYETGAYFRLQGSESFYPRVVVVFAVADSKEHHHLPLLLNRYGYTTYRGV